MKKKKKPSRVCHFKRTTAAKQFPLAGTCQKLKQNPNKKKTNEAIYSQSPVPSSSHSYCNILQVHGYKETRQQRIPSIWLVSLSIKGHGTNQPLPNSFFFHFCFVFSPIVGKRLEEKEEDCYYDYCYIRVLSLFFSVSVSIVFVAQRPL